MPASAYAGEYNANCYVFSTVCTVTLCLPHSVRTSLYVGHSYFHNSSKSRHCTVTCQEIVCKGDC